MASHKATRNKAVTQKPGTVVPTPYDCAELVSALKAIQNIAQCSSCRKVLRSVRTCNSGHGFCWSCKNRCNKICPLCSDMIQDSKPILLNNIVKLLPRQCKYFSKGCDSLVLAYDHSHEQFCRFRQTACRVPSCGAKCMAKDLLQHLERFHGQGIIRTSTFDQILMSFDAGIKKDGFAVIIAYNNIFWQHSRVGQNKLLQLYQYVPMEKPRENFFVDVTFYTPENKYSSTTPVHPDMYDPDQLFKDEATFCLPAKYAIPFKKFYAGVNYNFKITKHDIVQ